MKRSLITTIAALLVFAFTGVTALAITPVHSNIANRKMHVSHARRLPPKRSQKSNIANRRPHTQHPHRLPPQYSNRRNSVMEHRLDRVGADLHLKKSQQPAWNNFRKAVEGRFEAMQEYEREKMRDPSKTAPVQVHQRILLMKRRLHSLRAIQSVLDPFYRELTPMQRTIFNLEFGHPGEMPFRPRFNLAR